MKRHVVPPGEVAIMWRMSAGWRDGSNHDRHWRWYGSYAPKDAERFMRDKAPNAEPFEYKIRTNN